MQVVTKSRQCVAPECSEYFRNMALNANDPNLKAVGLGRRCCGAM